MHLKNLGRLLISRSVRQQALFKFLWNPLIRVSLLAKREWDWNRLDTGNMDGALSSEMLAELKVRRGPFEGLQYPEASSVGSALCAKLLGSYERELQPILERCLASDYTDIIDIGCAEGFYAVGFALKMPKVRVWAYDINPDALRLSEKMAELNQVSERVKLGSWCDAKVLKSLPLGRKALVISDCEGFEKELFRDEICEHLACHDLLIEAHDYMDPSISCTLTKRFRRTHDVEIIRNIPDFCRPQVYEYPELEHCDRATKISLLSELRPADMEWLFLRSTASGVNGAAQHFGPCYSQRITER